MPWSKPKSALGGNRTGGNMAPWGCNYIVRDTRSPHSHMVGIRPSLPLLVSEQWGAPAMLRRRRNGDGRGEGEGRTGALRPE